jgi:hypothetical protein
MAENEAAVQGLGFTDRKPRLVVFGVLQIIFGGFCSLAVPLMVVGMIASAAVAKEGAERPSLKMMIPGLLLYALMAVWFIWVGIGSVKARRWARALILVSSWPWLICGMLGFVFMLTLMPSMFEQMGESGKMPKGVVVVMQVVMTAFAAVFYVAVPGLLVLFYSGRDVKATCEYRDPQARWTDKCPLPVLGASIVCAICAVSLLSMGMYGWVVAFFGTVLSGMPGAIVIVVFALLFAYAAWGLYKLDNKAWWVAALAIAGWSVSWIVSYSNENMQLYYEKMNFSTQQLNMIKQYSTLFGPAMRWFFGFWAIAVLGYLAYIRRYFNCRQDENQT